jgi:hypothetical protein
VIVVGSFAFTLESFRVVVRPLFLEPSKLAVSVANFFGRHAHTFHHSNVNAREWGIVISFEVAASFELSVSTTC